VSAKQRMNSRSLFGLTLVTETPELDIMRLVPPRMLSPQISPAVHDATQGESISTSTFEETSARSSFRLEPEPADRPGDDKGGCLSMYSLGVTLPVTVFQQTERFFERPRSHVQTQVPGTIHRIRVSRDVRSGLVSYRHSCSHLTLVPKGTQIEEKGARQKTFKDSRLNPQPPCIINKLVQSKMIRFLGQPGEFDTFGTVRDGSYAVLPVPVGYVVACVFAGRTMWGGGRWVKVGEGEVGSLKVRMAEGRETEMG
jgi:hypothetical protein